MGNVKSNRVSAVLTATNLNAIKSSIKNIETLMPFLVGLTSIERKRMLKIHRGNRLFVNDALKAVGEMPELLPGYMSGAEMKKDYDLNEQLVLLEMQLASLLSKIRDTKTVTGNEAMVSALAVYRSAAAAAEQGVEGADVYFDRLRERWDAIAEETMEETTEEEGTDTPTA